MAAMCNFLEFRILLAVMDSVSIKHVCKRTLQMNILMTTD
jgi:hypothetical protein